MSSPVPLIVIACFGMLVCVAWYINTYNRFIKYKNMIEEAWSGIDVALKRRFNLVPNFVRAVQGYMKHEAEILSKEHHGGTDPSNVPGRMEEESQLSRSLNSLLALAENYPDLKASQNFISLQQTLNDIEEDIQKARNYYNRAVRKYNTLTESFPSRILAAKYNFLKANYFTLELATQREMILVDFSSPPDSEK